VDDDNDSTGVGLRRDLIDHLRSISSSLDGQQSGAADENIPLLVDIVEMPRRSEPLPPGAARNDRVPGAINRSDVQDVLEIEAQRIVDELLDELLPQLELRLRERLEARLQELVRLNARELLRDE
jgi:hypothetical protein